MARGQAVGTDPPRVQVARSPIQAIDRAVAILSVLSEVGPGGLPLRTLALDVGLHTSTAHTLLNALVTHGLAGQDEGSRRYRLGSRFLELNRIYMARADIASIAAPVVQALWDETSETVHLAVLQNFQRVDLTVLASPQILSVFPSNGRRDESPSVTLHRTAAGKVLLAGLSDAELDSYVARCDLTPATAHTLTDREDVRAELNTARDRGYAVNHEEEAIGVRGVAAPVRDALGNTVAALCIGYPSARSTEDNDLALRQAVIAAAGRLSRSMGAEDAMEAVS